MRRVHRRPGTIERNRAIKAEAAAQQELARVTKLAQQTVAELVQNAQTIIERVEQGRGSLD